MDLEQLKKWREAGREFLSAESVPATMNAEERTVDVIWYTGADVKRVHPWTGEVYMLRFDPAGADLSLLNAGAAVLQCHDKDEHYGSVEKAWKDKGQFKAKLRFKRSTELTGPRPEIDGLWQDIQDRIVNKFSMGVEFLEQPVETRDKGGRLTMLEVKKWRPFEISMDPIPADFGTCTLSAETGAGAQAARVCSAARQREIEILRLR